MEGAGLGVKGLLFVYRIICILANYICQCTLTFIRLYFRFALQYTCPRQKTHACFSKSLILKLSLLLCPYVHCHQVMKMCMSLSFNSDRISLHMTPELDIPQSNKLFSCSPMHFYNQSVCFSNFFLHFVQSGRTYHTVTYVVFS